MSKSRLTGAVLATAVALMFAGTVANAAGDSSGAPQVKCLGGNACKGQSACKTASSSCQGQNSCKGKGGCRTDGKKPPEEKSPSA